MGEYMGSRIRSFKFIEDLRINKDTYTAEQMANLVLLNTIKTKVPIDVVEIVKYLGFKALSADFKNDTVVGIASSETNLKIKNLEVSNYIVVKRDTTISEKRFLTSWCLSYFLLNANINEDYIKSFTIKDISDNVKTKEAIFARTILMPQNELSVFINSPIMKCESKAQLVSKVAEAFLVNEEVVEIRLEDMGYIM